jgi:photosystem II P680 reaction center D1 protein
VWRRLSFPNSRTLHLFLAALPVAGIWSAALGVDISAFNFHDLNLQQHEIRSQGKHLSTWADTIDWASLGVQMLDEHAYQHFPQDLSN